MNKKITLGLLSALLFLAVGCDYNDKYFDGYDDYTVTDVVQFEGDYTGNYPAQGFFADKVVVEAYVTSMLKATYPYADAGSTAKVNVLYGTITQDYEPTSTDITYELTTEDYDSMGTGDNEPGQYNNFDSDMDIDAYLKAFCATKYASEADGTTVAITFKYYGGPSPQVRGYVKTASGWDVYEMEPGFVADNSYTLTTEDYDSMGTASGTPGRYNNFDSNMDIDMYLTNFLRVNYPYTAAGATYNVSYVFYISQKDGSRTESRIYKYDGSAWAPYDPYAEHLEVTTKVAEMSYDGTAWTLVRLMGGSVTRTFTAEDYAALVADVKANKPAYMSTQKDNEEYYYGASAGYNNINNNYNTWRNYYSVDGYLDGKSDAEVQAIMDQHLAEGISTLLLPKWYPVGDSGLSYVVVYTIYNGRGNGDYAMNFIYNEETKAFEWTGSEPVKR
ncbi:MAG: hypothetical protein LBL97_05045 [Prevotellaceae bacterium]|jgi:hypothetical protein|nr:hypothetical protein [Prevotellaceae bacterium]